MTTRDDLQRVLDLDEKATGGPWEVTHNHFNKERQAVGRDGTAFLGWIDECPNCATCYANFANDAAATVSYRTLAPEMARQLVEIHEATDQYEGSTNPTDGAEFFFAIKSILGR